MVGHALKDCYIVDNVLMPPENVFISRMQGLCKNGACAYILNFNMDYATKDLNEVINFIIQSKYTGSGQMSSPFVEYVALIYNPILCIMNFVFRAYRSIELWVQTPKYAT